MTDYLTAARDAYAAGPTGGNTGGDFQFRDQPLPDVAPPAAAAGAMGGRGAIDYTTPFAIDHATGQLFAAGKPVPTDISQWQAVAASADKIPPMPRSLILQHNLTPLSTDQLHAAIAQIQQHATAPMLSNAGHALMSGLRDIPGGLASMSQTVAHGAAGEASALGLTGAASHLQDAARTFGDVSDDYAQANKAADVSQRAGLTMQEQAGNDAGFLQHPGTYIAAKGSTVAGGLGPMAGAFALNPGLGAAVVSGQTAQGSRTATEDSLREQINNMTPDQLASNPVYSHFRQQGLSDATARAAMIDTAGERAGAVGGALGAITAPLFGTIARGAMRMGSTAGIIPEALQGRFITRALATGAEGTGLTTATNVSAQMAGHAAAGVGTGSPTDYMNPEDMAVGAATMGLLGGMGRHTDPVAVTKASDMGAAADAAASHDAAAAPPAAAPAAPAPQPGQAADMFGGPPRAPAAPPAPAAAPAPLPYNPGQASMVPDVGPQPQPAHGPLIQQRMDEQNAPPPAQPNPPLALPNGPTNGQHDAAASLHQSLMHVNALLDSNQFNKRTKTGKATIAALVAERDRLTGELKNVQDDMLGQQIGMAREGRPAPTGASFVGDPASGQQEIPFGPGHEPSGDPRLTGNQLPTDYKPGTSVEPPPLPNPVPMSAEEAQARLKAQRARNPNNQPPQGDLFPKQLKQGLAQVAAGEPPAPAAEPPRAPGEPLHPWTPVDAQHSIPYTGGVSTDGRQVMLDKRLPRTVNVDGKDIDVHEAVALHERTEWPLMHEKGMSYAAAHKLATIAENKFVKAKYGVDPAKYQAALKDAIDTARSAAPRDGDIPPSLDAKPYNDMGEGHLVPGEGVTPSTPEPAGDLQAQADNLGKGSDALFVAKGNEAQMPTVRKGVRRVVRDEGTLFTTNPKKAARFRNAPKVDDAMLAQLQGLPETKAAAMSRGEPSVIAAEDSHGNVVKEALGTPGGPNDAVVAGATPPGGRSVRRTALQAQNRRAAKVATEGVPPTPAPRDGVPDAPAPRSRVDMIKDAAASKNAAARAGLKKKVPVTPAELAPHEAPTDVEARTKAATKVLLDDVAENHPQMLQDDAAPAARGRKPVPPVLALPLTDREMGDLSDRMLATAEHEASELDAGRWTAKSSALRRLLGTMGLDIPREADLQRVVREMAKTPVAELRALLNKLAPKIMDSTLMKGVVRGMDVVQHAVASQDKDLRGRAGVAEGEEPSDPYDNARLNAMKLGTGGPRAAVAAPTVNAEFSSDRVKVYDGDVPTNTADVVDHWLKVLDKHGEKFVSPVHLMTPEQARARYGAAVDAGMDGEGFSGTFKGPEGKPEDVVALDWKRLGEGPAALEALAHEMGHLIEAKVFTAMPDEDKAAVRSAFNDWLQTSGRGSPSEQMISRLPPALGDALRKTATQPDRAYASEWREWIADETAKWLLTAEKPSSGVDRFFARIANALKMLYAQVAGAGKPTDAVQRVFDNWVERSRDLRSADAAARAIDMNYGRDPSEEPRPAEQSRATIAAKAMKAKAEAAVAGAAQLRTGMAEALDGNPAAIKRSINKAVVQLKYGRTAQVLNKTIVALSSMNDVVGRYGGKEHGKFGEGLTRWDHAMRLAEKYSKLAHQQGQSALERAQRLSTPVRKELELLMYKSTVYGIHPDEAFGVGRNKHLDDKEPSVRDANLTRHAEVTTLWRKLQSVPGNPQQAYRDLRAAMTQLHEDLFDARRQNIDTLDISPEAKEEAHRLLNVAEQQRLKGPYFPLVREGNYITTVRMPQTSLGVFDTHEEASAAARRAKAINPHAQVTITHEAEGDYTAHVVEKAVYYHPTLADAYAARKGIEDELREAWGREGLSGAFDEMLDDKSTPLIAEPMGTLDYFRKAEVPTSGSFMKEVNKLNADGHIDPQAYKMLSEMYVDSLPETAPGKSMLYRENVRGASQNMLAGYGRRLLGAAHSYGQTKVGPERNASWSLMAKHRGDDPQYAGVLNTLSNRQRILAARMSSDPTNRIASTIQDASSFMSLGFAPAFLVQQLMQTMVVSAPVIAARAGLDGKAVGYGKTLDAVKTAYEGAVPFFTKRGATQFMTDMKRALGTYGGNGPTMQESAEQLINQFGKTDGERSLLRYMNDRGSLSFDYLNAVADATTMSAAGSKAKAILRMSMAFPQQVEAMNRVVTGLAAYRLALAERGMGHGDAVRDANAIVVQTHGDYSRYNRPSVFNRPLVGMALQFKMYTQFMYALLASSVAHGMDPRLSRTERAQAWRTLGYVLGSHATFGGLVGLGPVAGAAKLALGALIWAGAGAGLIDDKKKDQTTADYVAEHFEKWGDEMFGAGAGHELRGVGTYGLPALLGVDFAERIGLPDLTDTKFAGKSSAKDAPSKGLDNLMLTMLGPVYSNSKKLYDGTAALMDGDLHGAAKNILPAAPRAWLAAATEAQDGITTAQGKTLTAAKDISPYDTFIRTTGFSTTDTAMMYDDRARVQDAIDRYQAKRDELVKAYAQASPEDRPAIRAKVTDYNSGRPKEMQISSATLERALSPRAHAPSKLEVAAAKAIGQKNPH